MVTIFSEYESSRLHYTLKLIFGNVLGIEYELTTNINDCSPKKVTINYSNTNIEGSIQIIPIHLLSEKGIKQHIPKTGTWHGLPTLYPTNSGVIPFDLFSAVFYLVSRYEEYLPFNADSYGRFEAKESLAGKKGFLKLPIVDLWCKKLAEILDIFHLCPQIQPENYRFQLTVDIDQPWLHKNKGLLYSIGSLARCILLFKFTEFYNRALTLLNLRTDPGDTYNILSDSEKKLKNPIRYFIHCRNSGRYDKNRSTHHPAFLKLIKTLDEHNTVGIHPSYASNSDKVLLDEELTCLSAMVNRKITTSRQHYLKLSFPDTCQNLINKNITTDYSLGYSSSTGFRSGIARPYLFYNVLEEKETNLILTPLHIMDRTLLNYEMKTCEEAKGEFHYYTELIRSIGGTLVCLWHNASLSNTSEWKGWRDVFYEMISLNCEE